MPLFDTRRQRAALLILVLGFGLAIALAPYASGILGAPVIVALFGPLNTWLRRRTPPAVAAGTVIVMTILVIVIPGALVAGLVVAEAPGIAQSFGQGPLLARIGLLHLGPYAIGPHLRDLGDQLVSWLASGTLGFIGTATRTVLNITIALFGAYFLLLRADETWTAARPFIPFSDENVQRLRQRFRDVTNSTVIGVILVAAIQGALLGVMFAILGLPNVLFWTVVTAVLSILPVLGSALIWVPACARLVVDGRVGAALVLAVWGLLVVGGADNVIRPVVYRRWANIHPFVTLVGAFAGIRWFGLLGILVGPLALSYFFALIDMYEKDHMEHAERFRRTMEVPVVTSAPARAGNSPPGAQVTSGEHERSLE
jgi:predicted PurR-regulated permease PerM